jgi:hypothetical protein
VPEDAADLGNAQGGGVAGQDGVRRCELIIVMAFRI